MACLLLMVWATDISIRAVQWCGARAFLAGTSRQEPIRRRPVDWLDTNIDKNLNELADIAGDYYGDASSQHVLDELDRISIVKKK